jgi:hypothetical protein
MEYPFPEIYIAAGEVDPDTGAGNEMLVDGQQRMTTLYQYFSGAPDLKLRDIRPYSDLTSEEKLAFLEYEVVVRDLGKKSIEEIKEVFTRINSTKYSLNAMEVHNARFDGAFKEFGEQLSSHPFWEVHHVFTPADIRRMGDLTFCLTLTITLLTTYFNRDDALEEYLGRFNDEFSEGPRVQEDVERVFRFIDECELPADSRAWRKAELLTLLVELHRLMITDRIKLVARDVQRRLVQFFSTVEAASRNDVTDERALAYYRAAIQATNDRSNRIRRADIIHDILSGAVNESLLF